MNGRNIRYFHWRSIPTFQIFHGKSLWAKLVYFIVNSATKDLKMMAQWRNIREFYKYMKIFTANFQDFIAYVLNILQDFIEKCLNMISKISLMILSMILRISLRMFLKVFKIFLRILSNSKCALIFSFLRRFFTLLWNLK